MEETIVFIDDGFLSKLSKHLGKGKYLKTDKIIFSKNLSKKQNLFCKHIYYYTAPPFQSEKPIKDEAERYGKYKKFVRKLSKNKVLTIREGRCQRLKIDGKFIFKQKGVDALMIMDIISIPLEHPNIKKIILIACDSDFVPVVERLKKFNIKIILYTYYDKNRKSKFSTSNELIKAVHKYVLLNKEDFENASLKKSKDTEKKC